MVNLYQGQRHAGMPMTMLIVCCINCRHVAIDIIVTCAATAADYHEPFISHFSLTCPVIKTSVRRNLATTIVLDELVVKV